jgi:3-oxoacyl-[acyl-carrier protein] reductase
MIRDQVAIVTGAAKGLGRHIAQRFVAEGAKVALADIDFARLDKVAAELAKSGGDILAIKADVRNEGEVRGLVSQTLERFRRVDILVNNAAVVTHSHWWSSPWPPIRDMDVDFWRSVIETNLGGTFLCSKHVLPYMGKQSSGHIVNLFGGGSVKTVGVCAYVVSKEAIRVFTRYLAEEERERNICVVAVTPGSAIATEDAPEDVHRNFPSLDSLGNGLILAAEAPMELSGQVLTLKDGQFEVVE